MKQKDKIAEYLYENYMYNFLRVLIVILSFIHCIINDLTSWAFIFAILIFLNVFEWLILNKLFSLLRYTKDWTKYPME
jgi:hypothetical protein